MSEAATQDKQQEEAAQPRWLARIDQWLEDASDWLNPILVKETRQAMKSQQFLVWFLLLLAGCWVVTMVGLAYIGPSAYYGATGDQMYMWYAAMLAFPLLVVVPFSAFRSLASEQEDNTRDVLTVSALSPRQVINGKLGSAALQIAIYLSAIAPCLGFTYLLRGIDLVTLLLLPVLGALASLGLSLIGLLLASLSQQRYWQVLMSVAFIGGLLLLFGNVFWLVEELVEEGYRLYGDEDFWIGIGMILSLYLTTFLLVYFCAIACNTFTSANRSTPIRVAMAFQQALYVGWVTALWMIDTDFVVPAVGFLFALAYWCVAGMVLTGERPILSERVRRGLPESFAARMLFSWFTPGPGTGYLFAVSNILFCLALAMVGVLVSENRGILVGVSRDVALVLCLGTCYAIGYLGLGRLVILLLRRLADVSLLGAFLIHFLVLLVGSFFPMVFRETFERYRNMGFSYFDLPSPFLVMQHWDARLSPGEQFTSAILLGAFALSMLMVNLALTAFEIRQTRAPLPERIIEDDLELSPKEAPRPTNPWGDVAGSIE